MIIFKKLFVGGVCLEYFDKLYDDTENVKARFVGFTTEDVRYDFGIIHTNMFFGKPLVICMQTGRSTLLDADDIRNLEFLRSAFHIQSLKEAEDLSLFFEESITFTPLTTQYE
jgi:hypothetical protein